MNAATRALNPGLDLGPAPGVARTNASNTGKAFQKEMEATADGYHHRRAAMIRKVDPPVRVFWKPDPSAPSGRRQVVIFLKNPHLDFVGTWTARGGRAIVIEAKSTAGHRLPFKRETGLAEDQFNALRTWRLSGAAAALVWQWAGRCCLWTPEMLLAADAGGAKSLLFDAGLPVRRGPEGVVWDYLETLEGALYPENRVEVTYRGRAVYHTAVGWICDSPPVGPLPTVEKVLEAMDAAMAAK